MKGTLHQTSYGWIVRYIKSDNQIVHLPLHPDDQKYIFEKDHGSEVIFDTEMYEDYNHRPTMAKSITVKTARIIGIESEEMRENNFESDLSHINDMLSQAESRGLQAEVVMMALISMRRDPSQTIVQAMNTSMDEWIK